jgi:hypothetical protein
MIGLKVKKKRFTLLYLEENEVYVQDLSGSCTFYDFTSNNRKYLKLISIQILGLRKERFTFARRVSSSSQTTGISQYTSSSSER